MEYLKHLYEFGTTHWVEIMSIMSSLWAAAEGVVRLTPTKTDDGALHRLGALADKLLVWFPNMKKK